MRKFFYLFFIIFLNYFIVYSQQNKFFIHLSQKELATFNDAITLMRLLYNEKDENHHFIDNIIWAASKKLFRVTIPINRNQVNPVITRREFAYWLCRLFKLNGNIPPASRRSAYKICTDQGIIDAGRGPHDSFSGRELLDSFANFDYYVRVNQVKFRFEVLPLYADEYDGLPRWRKKLYQELEEQRKMEQKLKADKKRSKKEKIQKKIKEKEINEKYVE